MTADELEAIRIKAKVRSVIERATMRHALYKVIRNLMDTATFRECGTNCFTSPILLDRFCIRSKSIYIKVEGRTVYVEVNE